MILLDKSAFESFSRREHMLFSRYFHFQVLPPIMVTEIMADLRKSDPSAASGEVLVQRLARKFLGSGPPVHVPHPLLLRNDLLGDYVVMDGRLYPYSARMVSDPVQGPGMVVDVSPANETIMRWSYGKFTEHEMQRAEAWRAVMGPDGWEKHLKRERSRHAKSMGEVRQFVTEALSDPDGGSYWLNAICDKANLTENDRVNVFDRWLREHTSLQAFTPYGYHCIKADLAYMVASDSRLVPEKPTDLIDVTYLYYTPFCDIFVSNDKLHAELAPLVLRENQEFATGPALKGDLRGRGEEWEALDEAARDRRQFAFGMYPVPRRGSIITKWYLKYAGMWPGSGNSVTSLNAEQKELALKEARQSFLRAGIQVKWRNDRDKAPPPVDG